MGVPVRADVIASVPMYQCHQGNPDVGFQGIWSASPFVRSRAQSPRPPAHSIVTCNMNRKVVLVIVMSGLLLGMVRSPQSAPYFPEM